tara:strand:- start:26 stop:685 length:660 start_codon:yes stop_codon:yes gene_type:complete
MKKMDALFYLVFLLTGCSSEWRDFIREGNKSYKTGNFVKAKEIYQSAVEAKPDEPISNYNLGAALHQNKEFYLAEKYFLKSISQLKLEEQSKAYYNLGNSQFQTGNFRDAIRSYKSALRMNHEDLDSKHNLELVLKKLGQQQNQEASNNPKQANNENHAGNQIQRNQQKNPLTPNGQKMSKADAIRLLEALKNDAHEIRKQILHHQIARQPPSNSSKDW